MSEESGPADLHGVHVVVLNWNGADDTAACLNSLRPAQDAGARVLVVDNGSTDDSQSRLQRQFPDIEVLQTGANLGYTGGNNAGLAAALASGAEFVCVLNNDTIVAGDFLQPLVERARAASHAVALSPVIRYFGVPRIWFAGGAVDPGTGLGRHLQEDELDTQAIQAYATQLLTGCCIFAARSVWEKVGLFDDRFFLNFEDTQWSLRAITAGVRLEVVPASVVHHKVSASFRGSAAVLGSYYYARNGFTLQREHLREAKLGRAFVVHHALRPALRSVRRREPGSVARLVVTLLGLSSVPLKVHGPAPRPARLVARLGQRSASTRHE